MDAMKFRERLNYLEDIDPSDAAMKRRRGYEFEELILDIFDHHNLLVRRSYYTEDGSEQIDGAAEFANQVALIEVKWVQSGIAASELYSFCGKIDNKFYGTIGIFISKRELSDHFMNSLSKGRRQKVIVIHGKDIDNLVKEEFPLKEYLTETRRFLSTDNLNYISTNDFLKQYAAKDKQIKEKQNISNGCKTIVEKIISRNKQNTGQILINMESDCTDTNWSEPHALHRSG